MPANRRNLYRILQVQPEAPPEVIKASWRALMHGARMHPDLGGDPQAAALINHAYAVLGDAERRRAYDRSLDLTRMRAGRRGLEPGRGPSPAPSASAASAAPAAAQPPPPPRPATPRADPSRWRAEGCCPMCRAPLPPALGADSRCARCDAPLAPTPSLGHAQRELVGRRQTVRRARTEAALLFAEPRGRPIEARLVDLSLGGASLVSTDPVEAGSAVRIGTDTFDAVVRVVACHRAGTRWRVRVQWLTMRALHARGVYVRATA